MINTPRGMLPFNTAPYDVNFNRILYISMEYSSENSIYTLRGMNVR